MSVNIVDPHFVSLREWADFMVPNLEQFGNLGRLDDETQWKVWASELLNLSSISGNIPNPYQFDDWRTWAARCVQNLAEIP